jgi:hypothetical protein
MCVQVALMSIEVARTMCARTRLLVLVSDREDAAAGG